MNIKPDEQKKMRAELKKAARGRAMYFALMAPGSKKGKFRLSKQKSDVKPADFKKSYNPYVDDRDNDVDGTPCQGVVTCKDNILTLHVKGKAPGAGISFLEYLILRELKFKQIREIRFAETDGELPVVPENDPLDQPESRESLQRRLQSLQSRLATYLGQSTSEISALLDSAVRSLTSGDLDAADVALDAAELLLNDAGPASIAPQAEIPGESNRKVPETGANTVSTSNPDSPTAPSAPVGSAVPELPPISADDYRNLGAMAWDLLNGTGISRTDARRAAVRIAALHSVDEAGAYFRELAEVARELPVDSQEPDPIDLSDAALQLLSATKTWEATVDRLFDVMLELANALRQEGDADSVEVGDKVEQMINEFPPGLGVALPLLERAVRAGQSNAVATLRKLVLSEIRDSGQYLSEYRTYLIACENNPYEVDVEIESPLNDALKTVAICLKAI